MTDPLDLTCIHGIHKFVPLDEVQDHLDLGWIELLTGEPHPVMKDYRAHMVWVCPPECKMVIPGRVWL